MALWASTPQWAGVLLPLSESLYKRRLDLELPFNSSDESYLCTMRLLSVCTVTVIIPSRHEKMISVWHSVSWLTLNQVKSPICCKNNLHLWQLYLLSVWNTHIKNSIDYKSVGTVFLFCWFLCVLHSRSLARHKEIISPAPEKSLIWR